MRLNTRPSIRARSDRSFCTDGWSGILSGPHCSAASPGWVAQKKWPKHESTRDQGKIAFRSICAASPLLKIQNAAAVAAMPNGIPIPSIRLTSRRSLPLRRLMRTAIQSEAARIPSRRVEVFISDPVRVGERTSGTRRLPCNRQDRFHSASRSWASATSAWTKSTEHYASLFRAAHGLSAGRIASSRITSQASASFPIRCSSKQGRVKYGFIQSDVKGRAARIKRPLQSQSVPQDDNTSIEKYRPERPTDWSGMRTWQKHASRFEHSCSGGIDDESAAHYRAAASG